MTPRPTPSATLTLADVGLLPANLPFVDAVPSTKSRPGRRPGRTLRARLSRIMPVEMSSDEFYIIRPSGRGYGIFRARINQETGETDFNDTRVLFPPSLQSKLNDADLQAELMEFVMRVRSSLAKKADYKLHLDKEAPSYLTLAYSINGRPVEHLYIHPDRVDASPAAFDSVDKHEAFCRAVAQQNFNNIAYKQWREEYKQRFEDDIMTREVCRAYGDPAEVLAYEAAHQEVMNLHTLRRGGVTSSDELVVAENAATDVMAEDEVPTIPLSMAVEMSLAAKNAATVDEMPATPPIAAAIEEALNELASRANPKQLTTENVVAPEVILDPVATLRAAYKRAIAAESDFDYYAGPLGELVCKINSVSFADVEREHAEAKADYAERLMQTRTGLCDRHVGTGLSYAAQRHAPYSAIKNFLAQGDARDFLPHITVARLFNAGHRERLWSWLERFEHDVPLRSAAAESLVAAPLAGIVKIGLLGLPVMHTRETSLSPSAAARLASLLGVDAVDVAANRAALQTIRVQAPMVGTLTTQELLRKALTAREFDNVMTGQAGLSVSPYSSQYDREYAELVSAYVDALASTIPIERARPVVRSMEEILEEVVARRVPEVASVPTAVEMPTPEEIVEAVVESVPIDTTPQVVQDLAAMIEASLVDELEAPVADEMNTLEPLGDAPMQMSGLMNEDVAITSEPVAPQDESEVVVDAFLTACESASGPEDHNAIGILSDIAMLEGGAMAQRARAVLRSWQQSRTLQSHGYAVTLNDNESLFAGLQRIIQGHQDYFAHLPGDATWRKAHHALGQIYARHGLGALPADQMEWVKLGGYGDVVCYTTDGQLHYCRMNGEE